MRKRLEIDSTHLKNIGFLKDSHIKILKKSFDVRLHQRKGLVIVQGDDDQVDKCVQTVESLLNGVDRGKVLTEEAIQRACDYYLSEGGEDPKLKKSAILSGLGKNATQGQSVYLQSMRENTITFVNGPAGTGKTFLAVGMAVSWLLAGKVDRLVLVRPAVEAGEKLGFLPGDLNEKIKPYLMPIFDALRHFLGSMRVDSYLEKNIIEVAPLAYMRGRTLDHCFMILDEAQNTTVEQMKMFLTRLGKDSRAVVTGDLSQIDLPRGERSGMGYVMNILKNIEGIELLTLGTRDIVRHPVVADIVKAFAEDALNAQNKAESS